MNPKYTHDCTRCILVGQDDEYDFYFCPSHISSHTVIARWGNSCPNYLSGLETARALMNKGCADTNGEFIPPEHKSNAEHPLVKALKASIEKGLLPP